MYRSASLLIVLAAIVSSHQSNTANAQQSQLDLDALSAASDPAVARRAKQLKQGLAKRTWTYVGDDGKTRYHDDSFKSVFTNRGEQWVEFKSRARLPMGYLSQKDQTWINHILRLQGELEEDAARLAKQERQRAEEARMRAEAEARARLEEEDRKNPLVTVADVLVASTAELRVSGGTRTITLTRGEMLEVLDTGQNTITVAVGGQPVVVSKRAVRVRQVRLSELPAGIRQEMRRPAINDSTSNPGAPWPQRLDCDVDFVTNRGIVQVEINEVIRGGVGEKMGLRAGDTIVGVNDKELTSQDQFRQAIYARQAPRFLVRDQFGQRRIVRYTAPTQVRLFEGVVGRLNLNDEFEVRYVDPHDAVTRQLNLKRGDVILTVNRREVRSAADVARIARSSDGKLVFLILRAGTDVPETRSVTL